MNFPKEECIHISQLLNQTKRAITQKNSTQLKALSNQTIHDVCSFQDEASITIAVLLYTLSKLIERNNYKEIKSWDSLVKKFNSYIDLAIKAITQNNTEAYTKHILEARKIIESQSINLKPYIQDVLKKAAINKGSKLYSHGISLEQTARLLGTTQWELSEYIGQTNRDEKQNRTIDVKQRVKMAMEFFK
ncbi:MAG: hypothetical protein ABIG28_00370 [archaeon]